MSSGIYKITNTHNGKVYIGSSSNIQKRFKEHKRALKTHSHHSYKLQKDFNEIENIDVFSFEIIEEIDSNKIDLFRREQFYIDKYDSFNNGYNCCEYSANPKYFGFKRTSLYSKNTDFVNYVKIPRELIYDKDLTDKRVIIFSYLCARRSLDDTVAFSTTELCHWSKLKPNYRNGKINQKYYDVLSLLSHYGYFVECPDFEKLKIEKKNSTEYRLLKLNIEKFDIPDGFGLIYFDELEMILNFKEKLKNDYIDLARMSSSYILLLLSYLRVNMNRDLSKPLCCYRYYKKIHEDIGLSERYIGRIIEILDRLNIIKFKEIKKSKYIDENGKDIFRTNPKVFSDVRHYKKDNYGNMIIDNEYDCISEINKQIELFRSKNRELIYRQ